MSDAVHKKPKRGRPKTGDALTAAERMRRLRARRRKAGLRSISSWRPVEPATPLLYSPHRLLEARSLAMHALIAAKIANDPALLSKPRRNRELWSARWGCEVPRCAVESRRMLDRLWLEIAALISAARETAARLRPSSPFAGVLTPD